jgi:hypothetical protein
MHPSKHHHHAKADDLESDPGDDDLYELPIHHHDHDHDDADERKRDLHSMLPAPQSGNSPDTSPSASSKSSKSLQVRIYERLKRIYDPEKRKKKHIPKMKTENKSIMDIYRPNHIATSLLDHELDDIFERQREEHLYKSSITIV